MTTMKVKHSQATRGFWLWWLSATIIGIAMGMAIVFLGLAPLLDKSPQVGPLLYGGVVGAVLGATVGTSQWLVLRRHLAGAGWWVLLTFVAWLVFWVLEFSGLLSSLVGENTGIAFIPDILHLAIFGGIVGVFQWLLLQQKVKDAAWWVLVSMGSGMLGAAIADTVNFALGSDSPLDFLVGSILWGIITGAYMRWLLQKASTPPPHGNQLES